MSGCVIRRGVKNEGSNQKCPVVIACSWSVGFDINVGLQKKD